MQLVSLPYVELHITDHCNLNCKGCGHFSSLSQEWFADLLEYNSDFKQLSKLFANIETIKIMGGEPLLHPDISKFISIARNYFPKANLYLVTNGILLSKMKKEFWENCLNENIIIEITVYPPFIKKSIDFINLVKANNISVQSRQVVTFHAHRNILGTSDPDISFNICREYFYCPFLRNGNIYLCGFPALVHIFNKSFNFNIQPSGYISIYKPKVTGNEILNLINKPAIICQYCHYKFFNYKWDYTKKNIDEWNANI